MFSDKVFCFAFLFSLTVHALILLQNPKLNFYSPLKKETEAKTIYVKPRPKPPKNYQPAGHKNEPFLKIPAKISVAKIPPPPFVEREDIFKANRDKPARDIAFNKPAVIKSEIVALKKKITFSPPELDKHNNPVYLSYYQIVREKIRRAAYENYTLTETGEVYLVFVIQPDGYIKELRTIEEKSSTSRYLRGIAARSVKDAAPFPAFPKELDYPQLSFNLTIDFQVE